MSFDLEKFIEHQQAFLEVFDVEVTQRQAIAEVVKQHHCGDGYFSMDSIYDDMCEILGNTDRTRQLYNGIMAY
jgi:hypothetical protein